MLPGDRVLHYILRRPLGEGGMGAVWLAEHESLGRQVAIKALHKNLVASPELRERFKNEAQALARLQHPNIVALYDYVEQPEGTHLVLEYVEGLAMDDLIRTRTGPIPASRAVPMFRQILEGFAYAHRQGVVHRDVKPANVMVSDGDRIKILDFGIAKLAGEASKALTKTGTKMGTVLYMSPEQVLGKPLDARSDIYSLGILLFEMLTGRCPYDANATEYAVLTQIVNEPLPSPSTFYPGIPLELTAIIQRATAKDPAVRFQTCEEFLAALSGASVPAITPQAAIESPILAKEVVVRPVAAAASVAQAVAPSAQLDYPEAPAAPVRRKSRGGLWVLLFALLVGIGIVGFFVFDPGNAAQEDEKVRNWVRSFYQDLNKRDPGFFRAHYTDPVQQWFNATNVPISTVENEGLDWFARYEEASTVDWNTIRYTHNPNGTHQAEFMLDYARHDTQTGTRTAKRVRVTVRFNSDGKVFYIK